MAGGKEEDLELSDFEEEDLDAAPEVSLETKVQHSPQKVDENFTEDHEIDDHEKKDLGKNEHEEEDHEKNDLEKNGERMTEIEQRGKEINDREKRLKEMQHEREEAERTLKARQIGQTDLENALKRAGGQIASEKEARLLAESARTALEVERDTALKSKEEAEKAKLDSDTAFARMKATVQEAVRQRDEARRSLNEEKKQRESLGDQLERRNVRAAMEVSELEAKVADAKGETEKLRETFKQQDLRLLELEGSVKRLTDELTAERGKREDAEGKLAIADSEMIILSRNAEEAKSSKEKLSIAEHQLDELKEKAYSLEQKLKEEEQERAKGESELKAEKDARAREKAEVDARNLKLRSKFEELIRDKNTLKTALEEEREKAGNLSDELSTVQQEIRKSKVESTEEIESLGKELVAKDAEIGRLEGALREATKGGGLQALLDEEREARALAEKGQREAEGVIAIERGQLAEAERQREETFTSLAAAREESSTLRTRVESLEAEIASLKEALENAQSVASSREVDCESMNGKLAEASHREETLRDEAQKLADDIKKTKQEVADWKSRHESATHESEELMEELDKNSREVARLNMVVSQWRRAAEEANAKIASKEEIAQAAIAARAAAESSLKMADERAAELRQRAEEMAQQLDDIESGLESRLRTQGLGLSFGQWRWDDCMPWSSRRRRRRGGDEEGLAEGENGHLMEPLI